MAPESAWHFGFGAAAVGMFFGLVQYHFGRRYLPAAGDRPLGISSPEQASEARATFAKWIGLGALVIAILAGLSMAGTLDITPSRIGLTVDILLFVVVVGFFSWLFSSGQWTSEERRRLVVILVLFLGACAFWAVFEQAGSTLNLFADRSTSNSLFGINFPSSWFQSVNSLFIVIFSPVFAILWLKMGKRNPSSPAKFSIGLFLQAMGFALMILAGLAAAGGTKVSPMYLIVFYLFATFGELCLSPVGLSAMTKLAPERVGGLMMGVWFLASSVGNKIAGRMGGLYESMSLTTIFAINTVVPLLFALVLAALVGPIRRMLTR
jgi:POT family proton-dependent oligopeptide transporter